VALRQVVRTQYYERLRPLAAGHLVRSVETR
jgi:hypothetical protein